MFRNPRENDSQSLEVHIKPSTGRPPTPPDGRRPETMAASNLSTRSSSSKPLTPRPNSKSNVPLLGRQVTKKTVIGKMPGKPNGSILNFFKKVDSTVAEDGFFVSNGQGTDDSSSFRIRSLSPDDVDEMDSQQSDSYILEDARYNEVSGSVKRRRLSEGELENHIRGVRSGSTTSDLETSENSRDSVVDNESREMDALAVPETCTPPPPDTAPIVMSKPSRIGAFLNDSDAEDDFTQSLPRKVTDTLKPSDLGKAAAFATRDEYELAARQPTHIGEGVQISDLASIKKESANFSDYGGFDDIEDYPDMDDEFADGEEFIERKWMEEQARIEAAEDGFQSDYPGDGFDIGSGGNDAISASCPICDVSLGGVTPDEASRHVNACLDGNPIPIQDRVKIEPKDAKLMPPGAGSRFSRAAIARPGQANPFEFGSAGNTSSSAFSKIMSSHAEDAAWASAAAAEQAARGKPAYQRTCPFYKIMPGFYICVDAFRYGAVQGCNAYFLSHFHSDHYVGLTSNWCHGPIYCSKITANLVEQQLRVDPKWVVALDFEIKVEVPGTQGVGVTMIPANHCPGSSLFLFEKVTGHGLNPKVQRVLHCGDFRACPAHVAHPLLMSDIVDSVSGRSRQQKIDVCYLDTTYLNPRYSFPSQEDVINACADMCVSLKKERAEESDAWEVVKKERAGAGMAKFVSAAIKADQSIAMEVGSTKERGRLLVVCGTYSIGKERICMGIARALDCKIWAPPGKQRICAALEDPELMSRLTDDPREAQIHMQMLMEIRAETLQDYLNGHRPHFSRIVGFRPSGWNYRPPNSRFVESPAIQTVLMSDNWKSRYTMAELVPQRGSTREASCFGVPYSEHSSFRELTMFCCALRIEKIVPTVNVGSAASRVKMKSWIDRWLAERRKNGVIRIGDGEGMVQW